MKFPYGISDFQQIIAGGYHYVDRTGFLPLVEDSGRQLLLLRPRRFGKSLWLSVLENYYDIARKNDFEALFGNLAIGKNPTPNRNRYFVLKWDFSTIETQGSPQEIRQSLHDHINVQAAGFIQRYPSFLSCKIDIHENNALYSFQSLLAATQQAGHPLYLLIDEYDNFANEVMMGGQANAHQQRYQDLLYGEGLLKTLFKTVKAGASGQGLERVFIAGVSPVVMSDLTSGYNVAENIYLTAEFNDLCGFREDEIRAFVDQLVEEHSLSPAEGRTALQSMREYYNGYCFADGAEDSVYNPTLSLYFLKRFQRTGKPPTILLDENLSMDRGKLKYIAGLAHGDKLLIQALEGSQPLKIAALCQRFGVEEMSTIDKGERFLASLLYFFGVLTLTGKDMFANLQLRIPNQVIRKLYAESLSEYLLPPGNTDNVDTVVQQLYGFGDIQPLCHFIESKYFKVFDNRDYRWANELTVKTAFLSLLFNDQLYMTDSETVLDRTYADLTLIVRPDMRHYALQDILLEFKFVSLATAEVSGEQARTMNEVAITALPAVQAEMNKARLQLKKYQSALDKKYGDLLNLHSFAVVAVGFERLVWEKID